MKTYKYGLYGIKAVKIRDMLMITAFVLASLGTLAQSEKENPAGNETPICSKNESPYTDFDFVLGEWDFFTPEGTKIGEQTYTKREQGCLIVEEWKLNSGGTGLGMSFVDPKTGLWRQVWMSPMFHIDYSGKLNEEGAMVLEGTIYPTNDDPQSPVRGIWARQNDGSIRQEFFVLDTKTANWQPLFAGYTLPKN